ncbi:Uncharacterised protein [BD1-7 clade bacterium]|uniref:Outer membrane protein beta-barrel domain-containing protein n=1 Tax=BD1-7 clade bacterium TaxID=2029982 RepID=A0A5S9QCZ6_9GAMM|nr:Uncharacterised protein [BD1-7 clade bacterium]
MKKLLIASLLLGSCSVACADGDFFATAKPSVFSYNYVEGGFTTTENRGNGFNLKASHDVADNWAVSGGVVYSSENDVKYSDWRIGTEYHQQIVPEDVPGLDLVVRAQIQTLYTALNNWSDTDIGVRLGGGVRYQVAPNAEVYGNADLQTAGDTNIGISGGARYTFVDGLMAFGEVEFADGNAFSLGLRYQF